MCVYHGMMIVSCTLCARDQSGINVESLAGFSVPIWMIEKMRVQMVAMRTDLPKKYRSRSATPNVIEEVFTCTDRNLCVGRT